MLKKNLSNERLSEREIEIIKLVAQDFTDEEIATQLQLSIRTIGNHLRYIYAKLGVRGRAGAVYYSIINKIISLPE